MAGACSICFHPRRRQLDAYIKADSNYAPILRWLRDQHANDPAVRAYTTKFALRRHREQCLGLNPLPASGWESPKRRIVESGPPPSDDPSIDNPPITDAQITERARAILAGKLDELSAKELHALVIEGLKTQRAEAAARAKERGESEEDDDAKDDLRGALVALK